MASPRKSFKCSVEVIVNSVDAPGTHLKTKGDIYINICLLGIHQRTRLMPPYLPMTINQPLYFDKVFKSCYDAREVIQRLEREHILIELLQANASAPAVLASYETSAKDFLYPHSSERTHYTGGRRHILLSRTIDLSGVSPTLEFMVSLAIDDVTGIISAAKPRRQTKPITSYGKNPRRSRSPAWIPSSTYPNRSSLNTSGYVSRSLTSHTISTALKSDYAHRETQEKLRELAVPGEVKPAGPIYKTFGRRPFVVKHVDNSLIGRNHDSHIVLGDGLVVNDYSIPRVDSSMSLYSSNGGANRSRSVSPNYYRSYGPIRARTRSPSPSYRSYGTSRSVDFERQGRSRTPPRRSNLRATTGLSTTYDDHHYNDEYHSTKDCAICRLHRIHSEQSRRSKSAEQRQYTTTPTKLYSPDIYSSSPHYATSATLVRDPFRYRHGQSPAGELSDKVIHTLRHNLESYSSQPWHNYYSSYRYSDGHSDDDVLLDRSRRLMQD